MAEGLTTAGANTALDAVLAAYPWIKLHIGAPGAAGAGNAAAETTRKQAAFGAASSNAATNSGTLTWTTVAGSEDYTHYSGWTASTAGTCGHTGTVTANAVSAGDTFTVSVGGLSTSIATLAS